VVYVKKITVDNYDEFLKMALNQKFTMAQNIVETILENINTKKKQIPVFEIEVSDEDSIYTLSVQRDEFIQILNTNLIHFENEEAYEGCQKIIEAINYLKTKNG
jgi:6-phosphogluconolactonase/glucosamine-6-phosphate isomerase/deaminase